MSEERKDIESREGRRDLHVLDPAKVGPKRNPGDLVVDFSGIRKLDLTNLALLLTAQRNAELEDREVWLAGVTLQVWEALRAMGLGGLFKPFPVSGEAKA